MGIFSTSQFLGTFFGGAIGGLIYDIYDLNSVFLFTIFVAIIWWFSVAMLLAFAIQAMFAIILLEYVNYLQHYGLRREVGERHTEMHSWEHRSVWSRWTLLELPLHPAHHLKASSPMWDLRAYEKSPQLPCGYYACLWLAIFPPIWKRVMAKRIDTIQASS